MESSGRFEAIAQASRRARSTSQRLQGDARALRGRSLTLRERSSQLNRLLQHRALPPRARLAATRTSIETDVLRMIKSRLRIRG